MWRGGSAGGVVVRCATHEVPPPPPTQTRRVQKRPLFLSLRRARLLPTLYAKTLLVYTLLVWLNITCKCTFLGVCCAVYIKGSLFIYRAHMHQRFFRCNNSNILLENSVCIFETRKVEIIKSCAFSNLCQYRHHLQCQSFI